MLAACVGLGLLSAPATASGTEALAEVMDQLKANKQLIDEIKAAVRAGGKPLDDLICVGARFGNQWVHLGGARAIPYECTIGKKFLKIDGKLRLYDARGRELKLDERGFKHATQYRQTDLKWTWTAAPENRDDADGDGT
jgi:hypothetical protein